MGENSLEKIQTITDAGEENNGEHSESEKSLEREANGEGYIDESGRIIFFGCSMRGGYGQVSKNDLSQFPDVIEKLGYRLASRHQTRDWKNEEAPLSETEIHDRDYEWLKTAKVGVFEISNPSLGVGAEISDLIHLGRPVLCIFKEDIEEQISAYVRGKQGSHLVKVPFEVYAYRTMDDAEKIIKNFLESHLNEKKNPGTFQHKP